MYKLTSNSEIETEAIGRMIGSYLEPGDILCLNGDLGAGKTTLTKSIAKALSVEEYITSPSFTIVNEYHDGKHPLYHFDVYRINEIEELYEIGYEEYFFGEGICIIEWASMIEELLPEYAIRLELHRTNEENVREIWVAETSRSEALIKGLKEYETVRN